MGAIASQITSLTIVYSTVYADADQRKHQSSASLAFVRGIRRGPVNSPHKWPVTRKMFPFDGIIMNIRFKVVFWANSGYVSTEQTLFKWLNGHLGNVTVLTHWDGDKMAASFLTTFSTAFSRMKIYIFRLGFHWNLLPRVKLTIFHYWFR